MPMTKEEHENLLNELNNPDLEHTRRAEVLQLFREDYGSVLTDFESLTQIKTKLEETNEDLVKANSKLFRQLGIQDSPDLKKKEEEKTFSETVTISDLEKE